MRAAILVFITTCVIASAAAAADFPKPYSAPCVERENVFAFTEKPEVKLVAKDRYEITFGVKGNCDVAAAVVDEAGTVVRHLGAGVLGSNAPKPFQKNSLKQTIYWNGKDDIGVYPKEPDRLKARVQLGLKPVFERRLGGTSGRNLPGGVWGMAIDESGAYIVTSTGGGFSHASVRKFGHDGEYLNTVFPPPARLAEEKSAGMSCIEYEKGVRTRHGNDMYDSVAGGGGVMRGTTGQTPFCQVTLAGKRLVHLGTHPSANMYYLNTDGTSEIVGLGGIAIGRGKRDKGSGPWLASSPDGKWVYMIATVALGDHVVYRLAIDGSTKMEEFIGKRNKPGRDDVLLNHPVGIDCDPKGRVYVSDYANNRVQIFDANGKFLKGFKVDRPRLICVHRKTGAIYVQHSARADRGKSVYTITKFTSFDKPEAEFRADGIGTALMALDSWSAKPRLWVTRDLGEHHGKTTLGQGWRILEERGKKLELLVDLEKAAREDDGDSYAGRFAGDCFDNVVCDPTREQVYYRRSLVFDLKKGKYLGRFSPAVHTSYSDFSFDKRGYMHLHFNPGNYRAGVGRVDPQQARKSEDGRTLTYPELPYDYGVEKYGWTGMISTKDQPGAKTFQDGLGVNMQGDVVEQCNIYHVPKMEEEGYGFLAAAMNERKKTQYVDDGHPMFSYAKYMRGIQNLEKKGESVYSLKRRPGIPVMGGTAWTFDRTGELLKECAVIAGDLMNGTHIDEDRAIYFVSARPKLYDGKAFLYGRSGIIGGKRTAHPFTGSLIKAKPGEECRLVMPKALIPMDPLPKRPPEVLAVDYMSDEYMGKGAQGWVEGAEWIYAGASPIVAVGCSCPRQHLGLDWYKRPLVPEAYRRSIGILDTGGNLIMHVGKYGNFDDAPGGRNGAKPGGEDIGITLVRFISATDNYLVYGDWSEKLVVLKLDYHAEESAPIGGK